VNYLLWWKDGGVTDMLSTQCLTTAKCIDGIRFALDLDMLRAFGRVIYYERGPNLRSPQDPTREGR
jgi:hypothetical protein